jgi:hypothetical protein
MRKIKIRVCHYQKEYLSKKEQERIDEAEKIKLIASKFDFKC